MKKIVCLFLCFILTVSLVACGSDPGESAGFTPVSDGAVLGEGAKSFPLEIVDRDGNSITVTIYTDAEMVGTALQDVGIVEGSMGPYGLYISHVNGIEAVYEIDATYWAFYINGESSMTGVDQAPIVPGETYMLKVES